MKKPVFASLLFALFLVPVAGAQSGAMDRCQNVQACDGSSDRIIAEAEKALQTSHHREAATLLYPAVLSRKTSPLAKARASNALSNVLEQAGLYEYAAVQKRNATETTRAPSSAEFLEHARLMAKGKVKKQLILSAYKDAGDLAVSGANVQTLDRVIADYRAMGEQGQAAALQARRGEVKIRADENCARASCTSQRIIAAQVRDLGPVKYPREARRKVGNCSVTLNVTEGGLPVDLRADCSDPVFVEAAMIAVQESQFSPRYENGVPKPHYNVVMPFSFKP